MNRTQIVDAISDAINMNKSDVAKVLDAQNKLIGETLKRNDSFALGTAGKIEPQFRAARKGHNPKTGGSIDIPARNGAKFKPSKDLLGQLA